MVVVSALLVVDYIFYTFIAIGKGEMKVLASKWYFRGGNLDPCSLPLSPFV
jgi:hypothetical protein